MDILLAHAYFIQEDPHEREVMKPYPPLGILYNAAFLKREGFQVEVFDGTFQSLEEFRATVGRMRPPVVGFYTNLMTKFNVLTMMGIAKAAGATIILGGPEPVNYAQEYLDQGADVIVKGEGELTLTELLPHLARHGLNGLDAIQGIIFRRDDGAVIRTPDRPLIPNLSSLPWPAREAIDLPRYVETWRSHHGMGSVSLITARGCPFTCKWCSHSVYGVSHRRRTPLDVADEITWLQEQYRPDMVWYADDVLTIHRTWFLTYAAELKRRTIRLPFECISRADRLNEDIVKALAEMGCYRLWIGAESGSQRVLDLMDRKTDIQRVRAMTRLLQQHGIQAGMFIMLGYEGETLADLEETVDHLKASNPDLFLTTVAYPIKGTTFYQEIEGKVLSHHPWEASNDRDLTIAGRHSRRYYSFATRWMVNEVKLHRLLQSGNTPPTPRTALQAAKAFVNARAGRLGMRLTSHEVEA